MKTLDFIFLLIMMGFTPHIYAQGETCATAVDVTPGTYNADGPATGGGLDIGACGAAFIGSADWYKFTPTVDGTITISPAAGGSEELLLFSGTCGALICETYTGVQGGMLSAVAVTAGTEYFIEWGDNWSSAPFTWSFEFSPTNHLCFFASPLIVSPNPPSTNFIVGSTIWASSSPLSLSPSCVFNNSGSEIVNDVFYSFMIPAGETEVDILISALSSSGLNVLQYAIWDACGGNELYCNDFTDTIGSTTVSGLTGGVSYILQVSSAASELADFEIALQLVPACNVGDLSAALSGAVIDYCAGDIIDLSTDGSEVLVGNYYYAWAFIDTTDALNYLGILPSSGSSFSGNLDSTSSNQGIAPIPTGTYFIYGFYGNLIQADRCLTPNYAILNVLPPNHPDCVQCEVGDVSASLAGTTTTICSDGMLNLQTDGTEVVPAGESYVWVFIDQNSTDNYQFFGPANYSGIINEDLGAGNEIPAGTYTVIGVLTTANQTAQCGGTVATNSSFTVVILPANHPDCAPCEVGDIASSLVGTSSTICSDGVLNLQTDGTEVVPAGESYAWAFFDQNSTDTYLFLGPANYSGTINQDLGAGNEIPAGTYTVAGILTTNNQTEQCGVSVATDSNLTVIILPDNDTACISTRINDLALTQFSLFPNPNQGSFKVSFELAQSRDIEIKVFNVLGEQVYSKIIKRARGMVSETVNLLNANLGLYLVELSNGEYSSKHKVVVTK